MTDRRIQKNGSMVKSTYFSRGPVFGSPTPMSDGLYMPVTPDTGDLRSETLFWPLQVRVHECMHTHTHQEVDQVKI